MGPDLMKGGNVARLSDYRKVTRHKVLGEVLDHWEALRGGRLAPMRSELDPRRIENALEHAFILERSANADARFRIAGMGLSALMGMEVRGMPASSVIAPDARADFITILDGVFRRPEFVELDLSAGLAGHAADCPAQMLLLPVTGDDGGVNRILGALVVTGRTPPAPCRFRIVGQKVTRIVATDAVAVRSVATGFAEPPAPWNEPAPAAKPRPHLRLVTPED